MASVARPTAAPRLELIRDSQIGTAFGLWWGAVLLFLLGFWLRALDLDLGWLVVTVAWGLCAVSFAGGVWLVATALVGADRDNRVTFLLQQRQRVSLVLFAGAGLLLALALWVAIQQGVAGAFPTFAGIITLAAITAIAAVRQRSLPGDESGQERFLQVLVQQRQVVAMVLLGFGLVVVLAGVWGLLRGGFRAMWDNIPEGFGGVSIGLGLLGNGLSLLVQPPQQVSTKSLRLTVVLVGGLTGFFLAVASLWRIVWLWGGVIAKGIAGWQASEAWLVWLCIYLALLGLVLMFGGLSFARTEIRTSVTLRRSLYGYNTVVTGFVTLVILLVGNIIVNANLPNNWEWTKTRGLQSLSQTSKIILENLKEPVKIYVVMAENDVFHADMRHLLDNCQSYTSKLSAEYVSPDREPKRYNELAKKYPELERERSVVHGRELESGRGVLVVYSADAREEHAFIPTTALGGFEHADMRSRERRGTFSFKGENELMEKIQLLAENQKKPTLYFTQGRGELDIRDAVNEEDPFDSRWIHETGAGKFITKLKKDNYEVRGLIFAPQPRERVPDTIFAFSQKSPKDPHKIPDDAKVIVIANPARPFTKEVLQVLNEYMDKQVGKLFVLANHTITRDGGTYDNGLADFLKPFSVQLGKDLLVREPLHREDSAGEVKATAPRTTSNKIALAFKRNPLSLNWVQTVNPVPGAGLYQAETILHVQDPPNGVFWADTEFRSILLNAPGYIQFLRRTDKLEAKRSTEPRPVVVAVTDRSQKPRLIVVGDALPATNMYINKPAPYYDFLRSSLEWLAERPVEKLGIDAKERSTYVVDAQELDKNMTRLVLLPLGLIIIGIVGAGTGIWLVRRR